MTTQEMIAADPLPLAKGAKWTYDVTVKRFDRRRRQGDDEVADVDDRGHRRARKRTASPRIRVKGWPTDLARLRRRRRRRRPRRTLLRSGNNFLFGATAEPTLDGAEGWFSWPVIDGQKICPKAEMVYCWQVAAVETGYALSFYTGPDEQTFELEPGTGISRFHYAHHGTTNEVEAKLTTYTKGHR